MTQHIQIFWTHAGNVITIRRMASSAMLRRVALVRTDVSEELSASIRVTRNGELGTTLAVTSNRRTLRRHTKCHCKISGKLQNTYVGADYY
jgi:hypothetical protein